MEEFIMSLLKLYKTPKGKSDLDFEVMMYVNIQTVKILVDNRKEKYGVLK
jgi:hypothetical protein